MLLLFYIFIAAVFILIFYYFLLFSRLVLHRDKVSINQTSPPVSVIICARNEAENLRLFLPQILNQRYPEFQVVVVNDNSTDQSESVLQELKSNYPDLSIIKLAGNAKGNKKQAVLAGINSAKYNHLLFTDADCHPTSHNWIKEMAGYFDDNEKIILGYGAYIKIDGSWLNKLIRFETFLTALQYLSYAKAGMPYMGVGRNLGYTKQIFLSGNQFNSHLKIKSGDDDLFVNENASKRNTAICLNPDSFTLSIPKKSFMDWIVQKRRHVSTSYRYKFKHKILLGLFYLSQLLFYGLGFILMLNAFKLKILTTAILAKYLIQAIIYYKSAERLKANDLIKFLPILEISLIVVQFYIFIRNSINRPTEWN